MHYYLRSFFKGDLQIIYQELVLYSSSFMMNEWRMPKGLFYSCYLSEVWVVFFFFLWDIFKCRFWFSCTLITELISDLKIPISMVEEDGERRKILNLPSPKDYTAVQLSGVNKRKIQKVTQIITKTLLFSLIHSSLYLFDCYDVIISPEFQA